MNFKNIKVKLLFWYSITIFCILCIFSSVLLYVVYEQNIETVDAKLIAVANDINHDVAERYERNFIKGFDEGEEFLIKNLYVSIYKNDEKEFNKIATNHSSLITQKYMSFNQDKLQSFTLFDTLETQVRVIRLFSDKLSDKVYIEIATTLYDKINTPLQNLKWALLILVPCILFLSILIGFLIIRSSMLPVKKVINEVKDINVNDLNKRLDSNESNDEIEELITTFNEMLNRLGSSVSKIKQFSNDASHELRTPLTVLRGEIELGLRKDRKVNEYKVILQSSLEEISQLEKLIDSLLFLSNSDSIEIQNKFVSLDIDEILMEIISEYSYLTKEKNISIDFLSFENVKSQGYSSLVKVLMSNIINNSIKYSPKESKIIISLEQNTLKVKDFGIGIKEENLEYVFDRFYRVDEARGRGGCGLGLSIVKNIADVHSFELNINSKYGEYTEFIVEFK
jgi:heavy metal sensor kinase